MNKQKLLSLTIILVLFASNVFFAVTLVKTQNELSEAKQNLEENKTREPILKFTNLFIERILKAEGEVSFDTRLDLENAVRNLNDSEILNQWKKFVDAKDEIEAQREVKNLLGILSDKVQ